MGVVTHTKENGKFNITDNPKSIVSEAFRTIRTNLLYLLNSDDKKTVMLTSSISGEGKSFITYNLATVFALSEKKTIILSFDLRKPNINQQFDIVNKDGLSNYLVGQTTYEELIKPTPTKNLYIAMSGPVPPNPSELLESKKLTELFIRLRADFDYIIIDSPPIAIVSDAQLLAKHADVSLFVLRHNYTNKDILPFIDRYKTKKVMKNLCIVVNDVKIGSKYTGNYYYGYYGYEYGYAYIYGREHYSDLKPAKTLKSRLASLFNKS